MSTAVPIDAISVSRRFRQNLGDLSDLVESIAHLGLLHPVVVTADMELLAGQRRLEACRRLGWAEVPVIIVGHLHEAKAFLEAERDENTCRKDMLASETYALGKALEELERPKAEARQVEGGRSRSLCSTEHKLLTREIVGPALGMSPVQWFRLKHIGDRAKAGDAAAQDILQAIDKGEKTLRGGYEELREGVALTPSAPPSSCHLSAEQRVEQIRTLAAEGNRASQIAKTLAITEARVRLLAHKHDVVLPDGFIGKTGRIDSTRVISETINALSGLSIAVGLIDWSSVALNSDQTIGWLDAMEASMRMLKGFYNRLREAAE